MGVSPGQARVSGMAPRSRVARSGPTALSVGRRPGKAQPGGILRVLFLVLPPLSPLDDIVINSSEEKNKHIYIDGGFFGVLPEFFYWRSGGKG